MCDDIRIRLKPQPVIKIRLEPAPEIRIRIGDVQVIHYDDPYDGPYEVTPTRQTQILQTDGKTMTADVVVNPIPQNYGLITYNGFYMTVT